VRINFSLDETRQNILILIIRAPPDFVHYGTGDETRVKNRLNQNSYWGTL